MSEPFWNDKLEFLRAIRTGWCNNDYIEFLVDKVWKIDKAVNIIDYGCGFGYIALLMMPILPNGSTYTGVDISEPLLKEAETIFADSRYSTKFIKKDIKEFEANEIYDIAISQAVLRHIPNAENILRKMIQAVVPNGLVICMEGDLELEKAGRYFNGLDYIGLGLTELHRKMYRSELKLGGRDYRFGIKIPILMQELGLHNVGVRMNDSVKFINPNAGIKEYVEQFNAMTATWGWDKQLSEAEKEIKIKALMKKGLNRCEAEKFVDCDSEIAEYLTKNKDYTYIIQTPCTLISYGTK